MSMKPCVHSLAPHDNNDNDMELIRNVSFYSVGGWGIYVLVVPTCGGQSGALPAFLYPPLLRQGLTITRSLLALCARLAGKQALGIHRSLSASTVDTGICSHAWLFM